MTGRSTMLMRVFAPMLVLFLFLGQPAAGAAENCPNPAPPDACDPILPACIWTSVHTSMDVREVESELPHIAVAGTVLFHDAALPDFTSGNVWQGGDVCGGGAALVEQFTPYECSPNPLLGNPTYLDSPTLGEVSGQLHIGDLVIDVDNDQCGDFEAPYAIYEAGET